MSLFGIDFFIDVLDTVGNGFRKSAFRISTGDDYDTEYDKAYADFSTQSDRDLVEWLDYYDPKDIDDAPELDALRDVMKRRGLRR